MKATAQMELQDVLKKCEMKPLRFGGKTFDKERDGKRLTSLQARVYKLMSDGEWRTIPEIAKAVGGTESSVSARLRDLRKKDFKKLFPCKDVEREHVRRGLFRYRVVMK